MNIKQAETLSGVSRQNIRFYEREGLITPERNPENDYREYSMEHIVTLKQIRALRMLDMPLESIRQILQGKWAVGEAVAKQEEALIAQTEQLQAAIRFCRELRQVERMEELDVDTLLARMEQPEEKSSLCAKWLEDYRKVILSEREKVFTFVPDDAVTTAKEFTVALFAYANANGLDLVITREGMYPEFTINGIEYTAERFYTHIQGIPVATIRCTVRHPEDFEPDVPKGRKWYMKLLNLGWLPLILVLLYLCVYLRAGGLALFSSWEGWLILLSILAIVLTRIYRMWMFHFNENGKKE